MGNTGSTDCLPSPNVHLHEEVRQNGRINRQQDRDKEMMESTIRLLLLGAGESGKSTLFKQLHLLFSASRDFTASQRETYVKVVYGNIMQDMHTLLLAAPQHHNIEDPKASSAALNILAMPQKNTAIDQNVADMLLMVWNDPGLMQTWENRGDIQVQDSLEYFMREENLSRIAAEGYLPNNQDILRTRVRTAGIVQESFQIQNAKFEMYDVGGQRNERRKWINSFNDVTGIIFVAAISEYNQVLYEDNLTNRQDEAVQLFKEQLLSDTFINLPFILFLNKTDLFREKLPHIPFRFEGDAQSPPRNLDFQGPLCDPKKSYRIDGSDREFEVCYYSACNYLREVYESQKPDQKPQKIYTRFTNSVDTENIHHIMTSCKDIILRGNLGVRGFLPIQP